MASLKFEVRKETVEIKSSWVKEPVWVEQISLVREDGVELRRIGGGREKQAYFRYTDKDVCFEVTTSRYDADGHTETDTWVVLLGTALRKYSSLSKGRVTPAKAREIADNIEEALREWPLYPQEPPAQHVKFK